MTTLHIFMDVNLKFLQKKVKRSDCNVSTVVFRVFLSQTFPFIILTGNSMISCAV